jgi:hydrogenase maturation protease
MKILVAGMGNVLRGDDGFGVRVLEALRGSANLPQDVCTYEAGIGGVPLVQELMYGYDCLIVIDIVNRGALPGTLFVLRPDIQDVAPAHTVDAHYVEPSQVFMMAKALGVCPPQIYVVACQPESCEDASVGLQPAVERAISPALETVLGLIAGCKRPSVLESQ